MSPPKLIRTRPARLKLWQASVGWVFLIVRARTKEEARKIAEAKAAEHGYDGAEKCEPWELDARGEPGIVVEEVG